MLRRYVRCIRLAPPTSQWPVRRGLATEGPGRSNTPNPSSVDDTTTAEAKAESEDGRPIEKVKPGQRATAKGEQRVAKAQTANSARAKRYYERMSPIARQRKVVIDRQRRTGQAFTTDEIATLEAYAEDRRNNPPAKPGRPKRIATEGVEPKVKKNPRRPKTVAAEPKAKKRTVRPKKVVAEPSEQKAKKKLGRPRRAVTEPQEPKLKKKIGRPKKVVTESLDPKVKKERRRPKEAATDTLATTLREKPGRKKRSQDKPEVKEARQAKTKRGRVLEWGDTSLVQRSRVPDHIPTALLALNADHYDLPTFLAHAARTDPNPNSTVYKGTHYEYTVARSLQSYGFSLYRTGRSNDLGIDLVGTFTPPGTDEAAPKQEMRVIVQCKATAPQPNMIRELEGAYVGAPAGWRGDGILAMLVAREPATKGVREALQRSRWPMGLMQCTPTGAVLQFLWNAAASAAGLEGVGVTLKYGTGETDGGVVVEAGDNNKQHPLALTWMGKVVGADDSLVVS